MLASLAAIDRLGNAARKLDDDLRLHQRAVSFGDDVDGPFGRIDVRREATAAAWLPGPVPPVLVRSVEIITESTPDQWRDATHTTVFAERRNSSTVTTRQSSPPRPTHPPGVISTLQNQCHL
jgi:hypothetical protein